MTTELITQVSHYDCRILFAFRPDNLTFLSGASSAQIGVQSAK